VSPSCHLEQQRLTRGFCARLLSEWELRLKNNISRGHGRHAARRDPMRRPAVTQWALPLRQR